MMMFLEVFPWILMLSLAVTVICLRDLLSATFLLAAFSIMMCFIWTRLNAVDVAFTEAAVGAGISTLFLLATIANTENRQRRRRWGKALATLIPITILAGLLLYSLSGLPDYGSPHSPARLHVASRYISSSYEEAGVANMVTAILAYYRGYDTLGELTVIFTAGTAVVALLRRREKTFDKKGKSDG